MKILKLLILLPGILAVNIAIAQSDSHLNLSTPYPQKGAKLTFTYDAASTPLSGLPGKPEATVYIIESSANPQVKVDLQPEEGHYKGEFTVSAGAKAFFIKVSSGNIIDDNMGKGYISMVYSDKQPIEGAYAANAFILSSGMGTFYAKIIKDTEKAVALYKKEFETNPQLEKQYQEDFYTLMAPDASNAIAVKKKIADLATSDREKDQVLAASLFKAMGNAPAADSLTQVIKTRFPGGVTTTNETLKSIQQEKDPLKKEIIFKDYVAKNPQLPAASKDALILRLLPSFLSRLEMAGFDNYVAQLSDNASLPNVLNSVAWSWAVDSLHLAEAEKISKQSLDITLANNKAKVAADLTGNARGSYDAYADTYAFILWKEHKFNEAVKYMAEVYENDTSGDTELTDHYVLMLNSAGKYAKAKQVAEKSIVAGKSTDVLEKELKKSYVKVKGKATGFSTYWKKLQANNAARKEQDKKEFAAQQKALLNGERSAANQLQLAQVKKEFSKQMIKQTAPLFTLKDLAGKSVSLASLKGKTVIIDFWATWCGPCKMSFPGMQIAQNKYKNNPNVVFLFIDTRESGNNYLPGVKKFIAESNYTFHVLMDEIGADKRQSKVITAYKVDGIPTKFIIDKNGDIRFKYVGFSGSTEAVVNEVTAMIELVDDTIATTKGVTPGAPATGSR